MSLVTARGRKNAISRIVNSREAGYANRFSVYVRQNSTASWTLLDKDIPGGSKIELIYPGWPSDFEYGFAAQFHSGFGWNNFWKAKYHRADADQTIIGYDDSGNDNDYNDLVVDVSFSDEPGYPVIDLERLFSIDSGYGECRPIRILRVHWFVVSSENQRVGKFHSVEYIDDSFILLALNKEDMVLAYAPSNNLEIIKKTLGNKVRYSI